MEMFPPEQYEEVRSSFSDNFNFQQLDGAVSIDTCRDVYNFENEFPDLLPSETTQIPPNLTYNPVVDLQQAYNSKIQYYPSSIQQPATTQHLQPTQYNSITEPPISGQIKTDFNQATQWEPNYNYQGTSNSYSVPTTYQTQAINTTQSQDTSLQFLYKDPQTQQCFQYDPQTQLMMQLTQIPPVYQDIQCQVPLTLNENICPPVQTTQEPAKKLSKWRKKVLNSIEVCKVCGDRSSGWHYNVLACEGCKSFFKRSISRNDVHKCKYGGKCEMNLYMRKRCKACRLEHCHAKGMKAEFVQLPTVATEKAKKKRKNEDDIDAKNSAKRSCLPKLEIRPLNTVETDLIHSLLLSQNEFEHPSVVTVELLVMFIKRLPDFQKFCQHDQVILLKAASSETMMIRTARRYDPVHDTILVSNNDAYDMAGLRNDDLFQFCRKVSKLEVDNEEFAILTAMTVFSEREKLMEMEKVEQIQAEYASVLRAYVLYNKPKPIVRFGSLLNLVVDIRSLARANIEYCSSYKAKFPQLLKELWDIPN